MPFIGRDWRSPGEQWVKTHKGSWERLKLLDNRLHFCEFQSCSDSSSLDSDGSVSDNEIGQFYTNIDVNSRITSKCNKNKSNFQQRNLNFDNYVHDDSSSLKITASSPNFSLSSKSISSKKAFSLLAPSPNQNLKDSVVFLNNLNKNNEKNINNIFKSVVLRSNSKIKKIEDNYCKLPIKRITNSKTLEQDQYTITEYSSTAKRTKNTSIQNIISQFQQNQNSVTSLGEKKKRHYIRPLFEKQNSVQEQSNSLVSQKQKLFKCKNEEINSLQNDQLQDENFLIEKNLSNETNLNQALDSPVEKSIKQCILRLDLNTTQQNIKRHLEDDISLEHLTKQHLENQNQIQHLNKHQQSQKYQTKQNIDLNQLPQQISQLNSHQWQPHCPITLKCTKEVAGYNTISEAFYRLDFCNAIRDIRRFNYICKLLHLLITQNLTSLSGCATKFLFNLLEEVAFQVAGNQQNIHILHTLLYDVKKIMKKYYCWGRPLGSTLLWEQHLKTIEKICQLINNIEIKEPPKTAKSLTDLPAELIRAILLQLSDYKDLMNSGQAYVTMKSLLDEQHIWRELCKYHFTNKQIKQILSSNFKKNFEGNDEDLLKQSKNYDWEKIFHSLRKKFGLKEEYADCIFLCKHCRCLFWKSIGHPCLIAQLLENEINKENNELISSTSNQQRLAEYNDLPRRINPLINEQINLNRHINNLNRVNNNINNEIINRQNNINDNEENRFAHKIPDSIPISPEAFLKFFSL